MREHRVDDRRQQEERAEQRPPARAPPRPRCAIPALRRGAVRSRAATYPSPACPAADDRRACIPAPTGATGNLARRGPWASPPHLGVGACRRRCRCPGHQAPGASAEGRRRRGGLVGARRAVRRAPAFEAPRPRGVCAADVGVRRDVRDAQRRSRRAPSARADRLSGAHRPRDRPRRAARRPPPAALRAPAVDPGAGEGARLGALGLVPRAARHRDLRARPQPQAVPARGGADLRDVRPRRRLLLADPDRAAVVRRAGGPHARRRGRPRTAFTA